MLARRVLILAAAIAAGCAGAHDDNDDLGAPKPSRDLAIHFTLPPSDDDGGSVDDGGTDMTATCNQGDANMVAPGTGHCYMLFVPPKTWGDARLACLGLNAHLVTITTLEEDDLVEGLAGANPVWVGADDLDKPNTWVWVTGETFLSPNPLWLPGEPNYTGASGAREDCAALMRAVAGGFGLDDLVCALANPYVCERE